MFVPNPKGQDCKTLRSKTQDQESPQVASKEVVTRYPPGMPFYLLTLKVGSPIILLCNLDALRLMNGTRLIIKKLMRNVIVAPRRVAKSQTTTMTSHLANVRK